MSNQIIVPSLGESVTEATISYESTRDGTQLPYALGRHLAEFEES